MSEDTFQTVLLGAFNTKVCLYYVYNKDTQ